MLFKLVVTLESLGEVQKRDHTKERFGAVLFYSGVLFKMILQVKIFQKVWPS